jgi:hypothetical protein
MKTSIAILTLAWCVTLHAQTYVNFSTNNYSGTVAVLSFTIPTNTIVKLLNLNGSDSIFAVGATYQPQGWPITHDSDATVLYNLPVIGPATATLLYTSNVTSGNYASALVEFDAVNTTPQSAGFLVQPNGHQATVLLQESTNLTAWTSITNGTFPATNRAAFYRINFTVQ